MTNLTKALIVSMLSVLCCGCGLTKPRMGRYTYQLTMNERLADSMGDMPSVEVHLIATDIADGLVLQEISMTDYWNPNRPHFEDYTKRVLFFGQGYFNTQYLSRKDPIWKSWRAINASHFFVICDLPGVYKDKKDIKDPRRLILPLDAARWKHRLIKIVIDKDGVFCLTDRQPK